MPLFIERCVLRTDSGGEGTSRGGLGMRREIRMEQDDAVYSVLGDRAVIPPVGVGGGCPGGHLRVAKTNSEGEHEFDTPVSYTHLTLPTNREV